MFRQFYFSLESSFRPSMQTSSFSVSFRRSCKYGRAKNVLRTLEKDDGTHCHSTPRSFLVLFRYYCEQ